jgi:hypothetical protein
MGWSIYGGSGGMGRGWFFSRRRLCSSMDMAWWITMLLILIQVCLMEGLGSLSLSWKRVIVVTCVDARAPAVRTMRGATVQFRACNSSRSGWYLFILAVIVSGENLSFQYVHSSNKEGTMLRGASPL